MKRTNTTIPPRALQAIKNLWSLAKKPAKIRRQRRIVTYVCAALAVLAEHEGLILHFESCPQCGKPAVAAKDGQILCPYCEV